MALDDGCTGGPISGWLDGMIRACCDAHDRALDHTTDLATFIAANNDFFWCVWHVKPWLAGAAFAAVAGPVGLALYWFGPKRKVSK